MRKAKQKKASVRRAKTRDRLQPKDKHLTDAWKKRNAARAKKQEAYKKANG